MDTALVDRMKLLVERAGGQSALARRSGMSLGAIQRYLRGGEPTRAAMVRLVQATGVSMNWLIYGLSHEAAENSETFQPDTYKLYGLSEEGPARGWFQEVAYRMNATLSWPDPDCFAIVAADNTMAPEGIREGYVCIVSPNTRPNAGDVIFMRDDDNFVAFRTFKSPDYKSVSVSGWFIDNDKENAYVAFEDQMSKSRLKLVAPVIFVQRRT